MDLELTGTTAIVLASSAGLGRAAAQELVREGATVAINSRSEENLRSTEQAIAEETGVSRDRILRMECDLSETGRLRERIRESIERLGGLDILVTNSGGPTFQKRSFAEAELENFDELYESTVKSRIVAISEALPHLKETGGSITNIVAASSQEPPKNHVVRNTIRPSIYGLSKTLATEYAPEGIRVNCICPRKVVSPDDLADVRTSSDVVDGGAGADRGDLIEAKIREEIPLGKPGNPANFGKAAAFLASDAADHITGHNLTIDGGWTAHGY